MALRQASRWLLVLLTAWSLLGIAAVLDVDPLNPSKLLVTEAYAGDPDQFSDETAAHDPSSSDTSNSGNIFDDIIGWIENVIDDIFN